jgi:Flp pilus assembly pilin Flp
MGGGGLAVIGAGYGMLVTALGRRREREAGQSMVEYALTLVLVAIAIVVMLLVLGKTVKAVFSNVAVVLGT